MKDPFAEDFTGLHWRYPITKYLCKINQANINHCVLTSWYKIQVPMTRITYYKTKYSQTTPGNTYYYSFLTYKRRYHVRGAVVPELFGVTGPR